MNNIIDGRNASDTIKNEVKKNINSNSINPCLCVIQVGDDKASNLYIKNKKRACMEVGIEFKHYKFDEGTKASDIISKIEELNNDKTVNGILVQLPLPKGYDEGLIINSIDPIKDIDGLTYQNVGNLVLGNECFVPCTPLGIMELFKMYDVKLSGKDICIVGRSNLVGKPLIQLLLEKNATVSICHSKTSDITKYTKSADILIVAAGKANLITSDMVKNGCIVIDVGINKTDNELCGDVSFDEVSKKAALITPVPGGVGPMTVAALLKNVIKAYNIQKNKESNNAR